MTIVLVVAATLLFTGGLTGNVPRHNFAYAPSNVDTSGEVACVEANEGVILQGDNAVIMHTNPDCSEYVIQDCADTTSQPFVYRQVAPQRFEVTCRGLAQSSTIHPTTAVY